MDVVVVTRPDPIVDLASAKAHLRVEDDSDNAYIDALIEAATSWIDGPDGWLGRALGPQTLEARFDRFPYCDRQALLYPPFINIVSVSYDDASGVEQTVDASGYTLDRFGVLRAYGVNWPSSRQWPGSVRVRYRAGYVVDPQGDPLIEAVPLAIKHAILIMVGDMYANRESAVAGQVSTIPMPTTAENLLAPYRVWQV